MDLNLTWYILLGVLLAGYAILDGFDFGVGIIQPVLRDPRHRNVVVRAIGPLWDGNEVWLVTFGGALFAAFPEAYASILSAMYLPIMLLLFCLILRAVSIDFRNKVSSAFWKRCWDGGFFVSSFVASFVFGAAAGNLISGLALDERGEYLGSLADLFAVYPVLAGVLAIATFTLHGVIFLFLKSTEEVNKQLLPWMWHTWGVFLVVYILTTMMTLIEHPHVVDNIRRTPWAIPVVVLNVLCVANLPRSIYQKNYGQAFLSSCLNILCLVVLFFLSTFPNLATSTGPGESLTYTNAASSQGTLWLMLIYAMIGAPLIIAYTVIIYWTFRHPVEVQVG